MSIKYILVTTESIYIPAQGHGYPSENRTVEKNRYFNSDKELIDYLDTWGSNIKDPVIFEVSGRVSAKRKSIISLER